MPKVDTLGLEILFLLIPGIIALGVVKSIGPKRPSGPTKSTGCNADATAGIAISDANAKVDFLERQMRHLSIRSKGWWEPISGSPKRS
jgi:hypothetical protein